MDRDSRTPPPAELPGRRRSRAWSVLRAILTGLAGVFSFIVAIALGVVLHLDLPATRRVVAQQANRILAGLFCGEIHVERIGQIGLDGLDGVEVRIRDPLGFQVIEAAGVGARIGPVALVRSLAAGGKAPIRIDVRRVSIQSADVSLDADGVGDLRIANAFRPRTNEATGTETPPSTSRPVHVEAPNVTLDHAWVHRAGAVAGQGAGTPGLDVDLARLAARARVDTSGNGVVHVDLVRLGLASRGLPRRVDPRGVIGGRFEMPLAGDAPMDGEVTFEGDVGGMATTAEAGIAGKKVRARVDTIDATGEHAGVLTETAIHEELSLHAQATGDLAATPADPHRFEGSARLLLGGASVDVTGAATVGDVTRVHAKLGARHVDLAAVAKGAPVSDIALDARGALTFDDRGRGPVGVASLDTLPGRIAGQALPRVEVVGTFAHESIHVRAGTSGAATPADSPTPVELVVDFGPRPDHREGSVIDAGVRASISDLRRLPKIGASLGGSASVDGRAHVTLPEQTFEASAIVLGDKLTPASVAVGRLRVAARAEGNFTRPRVTAEVHARDVTGQGLALETVDAQAELAPNLVTGGLTVENVKLVAARHGSRPVTVALQALRLSPGQVDVEGAEVVGLGEPIHAGGRYDGRRGREQIEGKIDAPAIDLAVAARLIGQQDEVQSGKLALSGDGRFDRRTASATAHLHADLSDLKTKTVPTGKGVIDASIDGRRIEMNAHGVLENIGKVTLEADNLTIPGQPADLASWRRVSGRVNLGGELALAKLHKILPEGSIPFSELDGTVSVEGHLGRDSPEAPPEVSIHAHTNGLVVAGSSGDKEKVGRVGVQQTAPWRATGIDLGFDARNDGASGLTDVAARATDHYGSLVSIDLKTTLPYAELIANADPSLLRDRLAVAPTAVRISVPLRRLDQLPPVFGLTSTAGSVEANADFTGTPEDPRLHFVARGRGIENTFARELVVDSEIALDYDGKAAKLDVTAQRKGQSILDLTTRVEANAREALLAATGKGPVPEWTGSAGVRLTEFPLDVLPYLADHKLRGQINGELTLDDLHRDGHAKGRLEFGHLSVGRTQYESGTVTVAAEKGKLVATARIEQKGGFFDARGAAGLAWGSAVVPTIDLDHAEAKVSAQAFSAHVVQPFLPDAIPTLDGLIDGTASASQTDGKTKLQGKLTFRDGRLQLAALGEELRQVRATVTLTPDGKVTVRDVSATGPRGQVNAKADARLDGVRLLDATANVDIPKKHPLDVALQGQPLGAISGKVNVHAVPSSADARRTTITIEVPTLAVELPQVTKTGVQSLDDEPNKDIHVGVYRGRHSFAELPLSKADTTRAADAAKAQAEATSASQLDLEVKLGTVTVTRGNSANVVITGNPKVSVTSGDASAGAKITGEIHSTSGWVDVRGKRFEIDKASVVFDGASPPNPVVTATAQWDAADGTRVFVDFVGPVKTGKVVMRSEPPMTKDEILALVLFGTADGANPSASSASGSEATTNAAIGVGGGIAAQGLTEALDDLAGIKATARIDTTLANNPRPEVEVQLSPKISIGYAYVVGTPPITEPDTNIAKLEWRFHARWSLLTTFGDKGTTEVGALWQKHY